MAIINTSEATGTANEIVESLQVTGNGSLISEQSLSLFDFEQDKTPLSPEEEEKLFDELSLISLDRTDPSLKYDRDDIYFDR